MSLFRKKQKPDSASLFPPEQYEPVLRSSICTGEKTACFRSRESGKLTEIEVIRNAADLARFCAEYRVDIENIRTVY